MADFKGFAGAELQTSHEAETRIANIRPLFSDRQFDIYTQGGLVECDIFHDDGLIEPAIGQLYAVTWVHDGKPEPADRFRKLPLHKEVSDDGRVSIVRDPPKYSWDPAAPDLGGESEIHTNFNGRPWWINKDGVHLSYPDGTTEAFSASGLDQEGLVYTVEYGLPVVKGYQQYGEQVIGRNLKIGQWLVNHGLTSPYLSVFPDKVEAEHITPHSYILKISEVLRSIKEFAGQGEQIHVPLKNHEAAAHALAAYQGIQWLSDLATASAPIRDGSFETTFFGHYDNINRTINGSPTLPEDDYLRRLFSTLPGEPDIVPYDWRYFSRIFGSQSAGAHQRVLPADFQEFLREGDLALRSENPPITIERMLGWHTDRYRLGYNTGELSNMGSSGGNLNKKLAIDEVVIKYFIAEQIWYDNVSGEKPAGWEKMVAQRQQHSIDIGNINNLFVGVRGKDTDYLTPVMPQEGSLSRRGINVASRMAILTDIIYFTNAQLAEYGAEISETAETEVRATLGEPPDIDNFTSAKEVFEYFFRPGSRLTATEALRYGRRLDRYMSNADLLDLYGKIRSTHVFAMAGKTCVVAAA